MAVYYSIVPCCPSQGIATDYFEFPAPNTTPANGTYLYTGTPQVINGLTFTAGHCYTIDGKGTSVVNYNDAPAITNFTPAADCNDPNCYQCFGPLPAICYKLYSCDGQVIYSDSDLSLYLGQFIQLLLKPGCWFVSQTASPVECTGNNPTKVTPIPDSPCTCICTCYEVTGNPSSIFYIDCDGVEQTVIGNSKFCSLIPPIVTGGITGSIYDYGPCIDGECPQLCYEFRNCQTGQTLIVTNTQQITTYYINNSVVVLAGYEGCWSIDIAEDCTCPVNVSVIQAYTDCPSCIPTIAYQFTNCSNSSIILYSTNDFSSYINKSVELGCGGCWLVTEINFQPPATQPIDILYVYDDCALCNTDYYKLTNCANYGDVLYTYTDLANYVGSYIKVENCDGCYLVETTFTPYNAVAVSLLESYETCEDCGATAPCICTTIKNYDTVPHTYNYIDCEGVLEELTLQPGELSDKICMRGLIGDPACNCVELTIDGNKVYPVLQTTLINNQPTWNFVYNGLAYSIVYDTVDGWQITCPDVPGNVAAVLDDPMLPCPNGPWTVLQNAGINISLYNNSDILLSEGQLTYDSTVGGYTGIMTYNGYPFTFTLSNPAVSPDCGTWTLSYYNNQVNPPVDTSVASWTGDCDCLSGTYQSETPSNVYVVIHGFCSITSIDCSVGYDVFIPSATDDIKHYGDCTETGNPLKPWTCPRPNYTKRHITPGYDVPSCDVEKYEKFACNSAEILYKTVLQKRYGISNCCPEEEFDERWIIKKELADLQGLTDPNYVCTPVQTCCNNTPTCGCGCNTTPKPCNSQQ